MSTNRSPPTKRDQTTHAAPSETHSALEVHLRARKLPAILSDYSTAARRCTHTNASYERYLEELPAANWRAAR